MIFFIFLSSKNQSMSTFLWASSKYISILQTQNPNNLPLRYAQLFYMIKCHKFLLTLQNEWNTSSAVLRSTFLNFAHFLQAPVSLRQLSSLLGTMVQYYWVCGKQPENQIFLSAPKINPVEYNLDMIKLLFRLWVYNPEKKPKCAIITNYLCSKVSS